MMRNLGAGDPFVDSATIHSFRSCRIRFSWRLRARVRQPILTATHGGALDPSPFGLIAFSLSRRKDLKSGLIIGGAARHAPRRSRYRLASGSARLPRVAMLFELSSRVDHGASIGC